MDKNKDSKNALKLNLFQRMMEKPRVYAFVNWFKVDRHINGLISGILIIIIVALLAGGLIGSAITSRIDNYSSRVVVPTSVYFSKAASNPIKAYEHQTIDGVKFGCGSIHEHKAGEKTNGYSCRRGPIFTKSFYYKIDEPTLAAITNFIYDNVSWGPDIFTVKSFTFTNETAPANYISTPNISNYRAAYKLSRNDTVLTIHPKQLFPDLDYLSDSLSKHEDMLSELDYYVARVYYWWRAQVFIADGSNVTKKIHTSNSKKTTNDGYFASRGNMVYSEVSNQIVNKLKEAYYVNARSSSGSSATINGDAYVSNKNGKYDYYTNEKELYPADSKFTKGLNSIINYPTDQKETFAQFYARAAMLGDTTNHYSFDSKSNNFNNKIDKYTFGYNGIDASTNFGISPVSGQPLSYRDFASTSNGGRGYLNQLMRYLGNKNTELYIIYKGEGGTIKTPAPNKSYVKDLEKMLTATPSKPLTGAKDPWYQAVSNTTDQSNYPFLIGKTSDWLSTAISTLATDTSYFTETSDLDLLNATTSPLYNIDTDPATGDTNTSFTMDPNRDPFDGDSFTTSRDTYILNNLRNQKRYPSTTQSLSSNAALSAVDFYNSMFYSLARDFSVTASPASYYFDGNYYKSASDKVQANALANLTTSNYQIWKDYEFEKMFGIQPYDSANGNQAKLGQMAILANLLNYNQDIAMVIKGIKTQRTFMYGYLPASELKNIKAIQFMSDNGKKVNIPIYDSYTNSKFKLTDFRIDHNYFELNDPSVCGSPATPGCTKPTGQKKSYESYADAFNVKPWFTDYNLLAYYTNAVVTTGTYSIKFLNNDGTTTPINLKRGSKDNDNIGVSYTYNNQTVKTSSWNSNSTFDLFGTKKDTTATVNVLKSEDYYYVLTDMMYMQQFAGIMITNSASGKPEATVSPQSWKI